MPNSTNDLIHLSETYLAPNYHPLPVMLSSGEGCWLTDVEGKRYLDMLSGYSALNFGHRHPRLIAKAKEQLDKLTVTSRGFFAEELALLSKEMCEFLGTELCLFMNSGAEAVETAIKAARRWGYLKKGVKENCAKIITFVHNFHGRTTTIISFSDEGESRKAFGPYTEGFIRVPYGDFDALEKVVADETVAVLIEPIQGEGGIVIPPDGFLKDIRELCTKRDVLLIADEIQTGFERTGARLACDHEGVIPDLITLGKSLGGGIVPISVVAGKREVLELLVPGSHGSTFGGNSFACAIAREVLKLLVDEDFATKSKELGQWFITQLRNIPTTKVKDIRGKGLMIGVEFFAEAGVAWKYCEELFHLNVLCKDTRAQTLRFLPPLVISKDELTWALERIERVLR